MTYVPDWQNLPDAVAWIVASGQSASVAKAQLCSAIADENVRVRVTVSADESTYRGQTKTNGQVKPPPHLGPGDIDWGASRPVGKWSVGPRLGDHYSDTTPWQPRNLSLVEVSTNDVRKMWIKDEAIPPLPAFIVQPQNAFPAVPNKTGSGGGAGQDFIPAGYLPLQEAIERLARLRQPEVAKLLNEILAEYERLDQLRRLNGAARASVLNIGSAGHQYIDPDNQPFTSSNADRLKVLEAAVQSWAEHQVSAWGELRQALGEGQLGAEGIAPTGHQISIPILPWRTPDGLKARVFNQIKWWDGHLMSDFVVRPIIRESAFAKWLATVGATSAPHETPMLSPVLLAAMSEEQFSRFAENEGARRSSDVPHDLPAGTTLQPQEPYAVSVPREAAAKLPMPYQDDAQLDGWWTAGEAISWLVFGRPVHYLDWSEVWADFSKVDDPAGKVCAAEERLRNALAARRVTAWGQRQDDVLGPIISDTLEPIPAHIFAGPSALTVKHFDCAWPPTNLGRKYIGPAWKGICFKIREFRGAFSSDNRDAKPAVHDVERLLPPRVEAIPPAAVNQPAAYTVVPNKPGAGGVKMAGAVAAIIQAVEGGRVDIKSLRTMKQKELAILYPQAGRTLLVAARSRALGCLAKRTKTT